MRIAGTVNDSIVDGPGLRFTVFTQGCPHGCPGCHNPNTHDLAGGYEVGTDEIVLKIRKNPLLSGVTLSGGEPFLQSAECLEIAKEAHRMNLNVWAYTGYTWEHLMQENDSARMALLREVDVLVDGPYIADKRSLELDFCGSSNQRVIDVKQSLAQGAVVIRRKA